MKFLQTSLKKTQDQRGFTLVEMIVSLGIFTIVALVAVGALLKITDANKKSQSLKTAINNLNFALESMSREMRVGGTYHCMENVGGSPSINLTSFARKSCPNQDDDWIVAFRSSERGTDCNLVHAYWYKPIDGVEGGHTIQKAEQENCTQTSLDESDFHELISPDIVINNSLFTVDIRDEYPPRVFFWLKGYAGVRERERTEFELQTTISQRN